MKQEIEKRITEKENVIRTLTMEIADIRKGLKELTLDEYEIEDFIIKQCIRIKELRKNIKTLQYEVYELMQILKGNK